MTMSTHPLLRIPHAVDRGSIFRIERADAGGTKVVELTESRRRSRHIWRFFRSDEEVWAREFHRVLNQRAEGLL